MRIILQIIIVLVTVVFLGACNYVTYTPRSKANIQREKPSVVLLNRIIDFREEQGRWPFSKEDFIAAGKQYREAFDGFRYNYVHFRVVDSNRMNFDFAHHEKDDRAYNETQKTDLNSYSGRARFYKEKGIFVWKLKMN